MATSPRSRAQRESRPVCPECSRIVDPTKAACITEEGSRLKKHRAPRQELVGVYCSQDCALCAWVRGWPWNREIREGFGK